MSDPMQAMSDPMQAMKDRMQRTIDDLALQCVALKKENDALRAGRAAIIERAASIVLARWDDLPGDVADEIRSLAAVGS